MIPPNIVAEADKNRRNPDLGQALLVAWTVRDNPGISRKEILRRIWRPRPGQWDGIRKVLRTGISYRQSGLSKKDQGWYPTERLPPLISALERRVGVHLPEVSA